MRSGEWMHAAVAAVVLACALPTVAQASRGGLDVKTQAGDLRSERVGAAAGSPWVYLGPDRANVVRFAISGQDPSQVRAVLDSSNDVAVSGPLFESDDAGEVWRRSQQVTGEASDVVFDSQSRELVAHNDGLYVRDDGAPFFDLIQHPELEGDVRLDRVVSAPDAAAPVWVGGWQVSQGNNRVYRLDASLQAWTDVTPFQRPRTQAVELAVSTVPGLAAVAMRETDGSLRVFITQDNGGSWASSVTPLGAENLASLRWVGEQLFMAGFDRFELRPALWASDNGGSSWTLRLLGQPGQDGGMDVAGDPDHPGRVVAGASEGLYRSDDGGFTWQAPAPGGLEGFLRLEYQPQLGELWAGVRETGLWASNDGGETWSPRNHRLGAQPAVGVAASPTQTGELAAAIRADFITTGQVAVSTDGGLDWTQDVAPPSLFVSLVRYGPSGDLYATLTGDGQTLFQRDAGGEWHPVGFDWPENTFVQPIAMNFGLTEDTLLIGSSTFDFDTFERSDLVRRSGDGGATWQDVLSTGPLTGITHIERTQGPFGTRLFAFERANWLDATSRLWASDDDGLTWYETAEAVTAGYQGHLCSGDDGQLLMRLVDFDTFLDRLYRSLDGGSTWEELQGEVLPTIQVSTMHCPGDARQVFMGTPLGRVYVSNDGGENFDPTPLASEDTWGETRVESIELASTGLYVAHANGVWVNPDVTLPGPSPRALQVSSTTARMRHRVALEWEGGSAQVDIRRNGALIDTVANTGVWSLMQLGGATADGWQVCNAGTSECSESVPGI